MRKIFLQFTLVFTIIVSGLIAAREVQAVTVVDSAGDVGRGSSSYVDPGDGFARLAYYDVTNTDFVFVQCTNATCSTKVRTVVDATVSPTSAYDHTRSEIVRNGLGFATMVYTNGDSEIRMIYCQNADCSSRTARTSMGTGHWPSIVLNSSNFPRISFWNNSTVQFNLIDCNDVSCGSTNIRTMGPTGSLAGGWGRITLGGDGFVRGAFYVGGTNTQYFVQCTDDDCTAPNVNQSFTGANSGYHEAIYWDTTSGFARTMTISQTNSTSNYIQCSNATCTSNSVTNLPYGSYTQMYRDSGDGFGRISIKTATVNDLLFIRCTNASCSTNVQTTIDSANATGYFSDISRGNDGFAKISYTDDTNDDMMFMACGNADCTVEAQNNTAPTITVNPTASYSGYTRTGSSINWNIQFTATDAEQTGSNQLTYYVHTGPNRTGTQVATSTFNSGAVSLFHAYNSPGLVEGSNTLYLSVYDGTVYASGNPSFTVLRDSVAPNAATSISTNPATVLANNQYTVTFTSTDATSTNSNELAYQIRTASGGGGTQLTAFANFTTGGSPTSALITDAALAPGANTRYVRVCDGAFNCTSTAFTVTEVAPPTVAVQAPTNLTSSSVTLNATANPNNDTTTAYFRRWDYNPGACLDAGGVRVPIAGGTSLTGAGAQAFTQNLTSLIPNKTYYYCAIASNGAGTVYYGDTATTAATFSTPNGPQSGCDGSPTGAITISGTSNCSFPGANNITGPDGVALTMNSGAILTIQSGQTVVFNTISKTGAIINKIAGGVMRKGYIWVKDTDGDGRYDPASILYSSSGVTPPGAGYVRRSTLVGGSYLSDAYDCNDGSSSVNTPDCKPAGVAPLGVTNKTGIAATLNSAANPNGDAGTRAYFKWGSANTGDCDTLASSTSATLITGTTNQNFSANISGLVQGNSYYWCTIVYNNSGTSYGPIEIFQSYAQPTVTTSAASSITNSSANLNSVINPNSTTTNRRYRYGTSNVPCASLGSVSSDSNIGNGSGNVSPNAFSVATSANTTYYFCAEATNLGGTTQGNVLSFLSAPAVPTGVSATANSATQITLTWTTQTGATNYQILRCTGASCSPSAYTTDNAPTFVDTGLTCGTVYGYAVQSTNAGGNSNTSSTSYATTSSCVIGLGASNVYEYNDIVVPGDGLPVITYYNSSTGWRIVKCANTDCNSLTADTAIPQYSGNQTGGARLAVMSNGFPIAVYDGDSGLTAYKCTNAACSTGTTTVLVADTSEGQWPDVVVPSDNNPAIAYNDNTSGTVKLFKCNSSTCTGGSAVTVYSTLPSGQNTSVTLSSDGFPFLVYGIDQDGLGYTKCGNASCSSGNSNGMIRTYSPSGSSFPTRTDAARGSDGLPVIVHENENSNATGAYTIWVDKCTNATCSTRTSTSLDTTVLGFVGIAVGPDTLPIIVYGKSSTGLRAVKCGNTSCSSGNTTTTLFSGGVPGATGTRVAVNGSSIPYIVFTNSSAPAGAKLFKCANATCN